MTSHKKRKIIKPDDPDDLDDGGDASSGGGPVSGGIVITAEQYEVYLRACATQERRLEQRKFGPVPPTEDPNRLLVEEAHQPGTACDAQLLAHPLLTLSQQFSGDDPKVNADPMANPNARQRFNENRLENQFRKSPSLSRRRSSTPGR